MTSAKINSIVLASVEQTLAMEAWLSYCKLGMLDIGKSAGLNEESRVLLTIVVFVSFNSLWLIMSMTSRSLPSNLPSAPCVS